MKQRDGHERPLFGFINSEIKFFDNLYCTRWLGYSCAERIELIHYKLTAIRDDRSGNTEADTEAGDLIDKTNPPWYNLSTL